MNRKLDSNPFISKLKLSGTQIVVILSFAESKLKNKLKKHRISCPPNLLDDFQGKLKQMVSFYHKNTLVILSGLGDKEEFQKENMDLVFNNLKKFISNLKSDKSKIYILPEEDIGKKELNILDQVIFQIDRTNYEFDKYQNNFLESKKLEKSSNKISKKNKKNVSLKSKSKKKNNSSIPDKSKYHIYLEAKTVKRVSNHSHMFNSLNLVRDLGNEPANILHPLEYVNRVKARGKQSGFKVKVLDSKNLKKLGLNSLLSVSAGSKWDGYLVEITLPKTKKKGKKVCLVGKGITFDTGGISLKGPKKMYEMKTDMLGSATVLGIMDYLAQVKSNLNVVGYLAIAENMPDANATRPGDVVTAYNGKTIEIMDTDAEGRLVLADALVYAQKHQNPDLMIDFATLTGQQESISCSLFSSLMTFDKDLEKNLLETGDSVMEKLVAFPIYPEYVKHTESEVADVKNSEFKCRADMIQAGAFLSNFVEKGRCWAHLDIAGPARYQGEISGVGVRLIVDYLNHKL